ncbi:hypothetical protein HZC00_03070 [Candidatus Kaiserbacteria bacterium]|nr:hypothetical protein [Candidatus Kaiserbacteria bacterium]
MNDRSSQRGFVALMSVIVISAILLMLIFTLGIASFFDRFDTFDTESKRASLDLAETCANMAILKIAQDADYVPASGGECISASDICGTPRAERVCKICSVVLRGSEYSITTRAVINGAYSNVQVKGSLTTENFLVTSWSEVSVYSGPTCIVP